MSPSQPLGAEARNIPEGPRGPTGPQGVAENVVRNYRIALDRYYGATGWQGPSGPPPLISGAARLFAADPRSDEQIGKNEQIWLDDLERSSDPALSEKYANLLAFRPRIHAEAWEVLLGSTQLQEFFLGKSPVEAFIVSVDIRKSTELMLLAVTHGAFAKFITDLSRELGRIIVNNHGIYDKFTGDGALAYFPEFFTGEEAGYWALRAAEECHGCFEQKYREHQSTFKTVLATAGLGIGIDAGSVSIVRILEVPTVVGEPVVRACRLNGAEAGKTLVNQQAFDRLFPAADRKYSFVEEVFNAKEGAYLVHSVRQTDKDGEPKSPKWKVTLGR